jgi:molybdate transport system regulatory protein
MSLRCYNSTSIMVRHKQLITESSMRERSTHACIVSIPDESRCLDTIQMNRLEQSFRNWAEGAPRADVRLSRRRILLIFLLIRYTAGKLSEVLAINPFQDIDIKHHKVFLGKAEKKARRAAREVRIPEALSEEIKSSLDAPDFKKYMDGLFRVDPGHVRRKFYERAKDSGFPPAMGAPESIRKSRAIELMQSNVPLPVVQRMLGHSTLNMTASYVDFSDDDMQKVAHYFVEKESRRKTSARNSFFGKITSIKKGDIQAKVDLITLSGDTVTTIITRDSLSRLGLKTGSLITAEVKAPWVVLQKSDKEPASTAENRFEGVITRISKGKITTEYVVSISDGTELCSIVTSDNASRMGFQENDKVWAIFNSYSVVLHID